MWMHNGAIEGFDRVRRDLLLAVDADLFPHIEGSTDSETMFYLALTLGLEEDPPAAVARMAGLVERTGDRKSTRLNSSHVKISYAVFCLKKKNILHFILYR